jgi:hypothetical protein
MSQTRILTAAALAVALAVSAASAQQQRQQDQRLNGTIERVDGNIIYAKGRDGSAITLKLADNATVTAVLKATVADIKPGAYIGSGAMPQPDAGECAYRALRGRQQGRPQSGRGLQGPGGDQAG